MSHIRGAIATPHYLATRAGERAFANGGTAIDAAITAATVLAVVYPHMCALGGDAQAMFAAPAGTVRALSGSGAAASRIDVAQLARSHASMPVYGVDAITVPGLVAAWGELHAAGGRLPWRALFGDAIALAQEGVAVASSLGRDLAALHPRLALDAGMRSVFFNAAARPLATGQPLRQPALAATLRTIADAGAGCLYQGSLAERLLGGLQELGSVLALDDLAAHLSEWLEPLAGRFGDAEILTAPPPSQGYVLLQLAAAVQALGLGAADPLGSQAAVLARLCFLTAQERERLLGDPRHVAQDVTQWLSGARIRELAAVAADPSRGLVLPPAQPRPAGDTVAIVSMDADGSAVSLIQSVFHPFGAGILEPHTGIVLHNRGAAFTLTPGPAQLAGRRRPPSTLTPALLRREGRVQAAIGAMGGKSQPQILLQLLLRLAGGADGAKAIGAPRWVAGNFGAQDAPAVLIEGRVPGEARKVLAGAGLPLVVGAQQDDRAGHAQLVRAEPGGGWVRASDPRGDGAEAFGVQD